MKQLALLLLLIASCIGTEGSLMEVPRSECEALRDHLVEMQVAAGAGASEPSERVAEELERHRQNLKTIYGDRFVTNCQLKSSPEYIDCALDALDRASLASCREFKEVTR